MLTKPPIPYGPLRLQACFNSVLNVKVLVGAFNQGHDCEIFANLHFFALLGSPTLCILYCTCLGFRSKGFSIKDFLILFCFGKDLL